jgi:ribosomal protein S8
MKLSDLEKLKQKGFIKDYTETGSSKKTLKSKYKNERTEVDGIVFMSQREAGRYIALRYLKNAGKIKDLKLQVEYELNPGGTHSLKYIADFQYYDIETGQTIVEDCKGFRTPVYRKKRKLMLKVHNIQILET